MQTQTEYEISYIPGAIATDVGGTYLTGGETFGLVYTLEDFARGRAEWMSRGPTQVVEGGYVVPVCDSIDLNRWICQSAMLVAIGFAYNQDREVSISWHGFTQSDTHYNLSCIFFFFVFSFACMFVIAACATSPSDRTLPSVRGTGNK